MGKTTLYHPLPLSVIRGAAEYCGFRFGKIKQLWGDREKREARYDVEITKMPGDMKDKATLLRIHHDLQNCFMDDVRVHWVHMTQNGKWCCQLMIELKNADLPLVELIPNPDPSVEPIHSSKNGKV